MKMNRVLLMALVAGGAASSVMAQPFSDVTRIKSKGVNATKQSGVESRDVVYVDPVAVYVNGVQVPFTIGGQGGEDAAVVVYDNVPAVADPFTFQNSGQGALDDITLAASGPVRITGVRPSFGTGAVVQFPTTNMGVGVIWYNTLDPNAPAGTSVASDPQSGLLEVFVVFAPPQTGWAPNTAYTASNYAFFSNNVTTSNTGAVEVIMLDATGGFLNFDFVPAFESTPVQIGSSENLAWLDGNNDAIYEATEAASAIEPDRANLRIALHAEIADNASGRCCLSDGSCIVTTMARCTTLAGTFGGAGTTCAGNTCGTAPVLWNNGPIATGTTSISGSTAPGGAQWSEAVRQDNCAVSTAGVAANGLGNPQSRLADNFVVPAGQTWTLQNVTVYGYQTGSTATASPFNRVTMRIWDGVPGEAGSNIVFGDDTTNLYSSSTATFAGAYRIFNTAGGAGANAQVNRPVWQVQVPVAVTLPAGTYYVDYDLGASNGGALFVPQVSPMVNGQGVYTIEGANAKQFFGGTFNIWSDVGTAAAGVPGTNATGCFASNIEVPFIVRGTSAGGPTCYANCDQSTQVPVLNVADFSCFLTKFAANDPYANCDASTQIPVLNVADFSCFLTKFAAGCP